MTSIRIVLLLAAGLALAAAPADGWARSHKLRTPHERTHRPRKPRLTGRIRTPRLPRVRPYRSRPVTIRRPDGTELHGYRDNYGTHLTGPDGRTIECSRSRFPADQIDVVCH